MFCKKTTGIYILSLLSFQLDFYVKNKTWWIYNPWNFSLVADCWIISWNCWFYFTKLSQIEKATIVLAEKRKVKNMILLCLCLPLLYVLMVHEHEHETICNIQLKGDTMTQNTCSATNSSELYWYILCV